MLQQMQALLPTFYSEEEFNSKIEKMSDYFSYEWQTSGDKSECFMNHFKEQNFSLLFNSC